MISTVQNSLRDEEMVVFVYSMEIVRQINRDNESDNKTPKWCCEVAAMTRQNVFYSIYVFIHHNFCDMQMIHD